MSYLLILSFIVILISLNDGTPVQMKNSHEKAIEILERHPLIDGHNDLAYMIRKNFRNNIELFNLEDMTKYMLNVTNITHTDLNRIKKGKLRSQFWAIYAPCSTTAKDATRIHLEQIDLIKRLNDEYSNFF